MKWSRSVMSDSLRPHRLQPTRLLHPWDFPGKSTGVGCHFLLQRIFPTQGSNPVSRIVGRCFIVWATREACIPWRLYLNFIASQATIWKYLIDDITGLVFKSLESDRLNFLLPVLKESNDGLPYLKYFGLLRMMLVDLLLTYNSCFLMCFPFIQV